MKWQKTADNVWSLELAGACQLVAFRKSNGKHGWFLTSFQQELTGEKETLEAAIATVENEAYKLFSGIISALSNLHVEPFGGDKKHYTLSIEASPGRETFTLREKLSAGTKFKYGGNAYEVLEVEKAKDKEHWSHVSRILQ